MRSLTVNIATQVRKTIDREIKVISFVIQFSFHTIIHYSDLNIQERTLQFVFILFIKDQFFRIDVMFIFVN
jgi:hypothetical protein